MIVKRQNKKYDINKKCKKKRFFAKLAMPFECGILCDV